MNDRQKQYLELSKKVFGMLPVKEDRAFWFAYANLTVEWMALTDQERDELNEEALQEQLAAQQARGLASTGNDLQEKYVHRARSSPHRQHHNGQPTRRAFNDQAAKFYRRKGRYVWEPVS